MTRAITITTYLQPITTRVKRRRYLTFEVPVQDTIIRFEGKEYRVLEVIEKALEGKQLRVEMRVIGVKHE